MYWIIFLTVLLYLIYKRYSGNKNFFIDLGIKHEKPIFLFGNYGVQTFIIGQPIADVTRALYNKYSEEKVYGIFEHTTPVIIIRDLDLAKQMAIRDFNYFTARTDELSDPELDPLITLHISNLTKQDWHDMRATLSPMFTTSKIKHMFYFLSQCAQQLTDHLIMESEKIDLNILNVKELFSLYSIDTIASCAFGIEVDSHKNPDNSFYQITRRIFRPQNFNQKLRNAIFFRNPKLAKFLNIKFFDDETGNYFRTLIFGAMDERIKNNDNSRPDMIKILMQIRNGTFKEDNITTDQDSVEGFATATDYSQIKSTKSKRNWSDDHLLAQCLLFTFSGVDTPSTALAFGAIELALNEDVQEKLYSKIIETETQLNGKPINYETLLKMEYLDMVLSEILRKWPITDSLTRVCTKDYILDNEKLLKMKLKIGTCIKIPTVGIHFDHKYHPRPYNFDPERFSSENIHKIVPGSYIPFGFGPRNCIASRLALLSMKIVLYKLIKEFKFEVCSKTDLPLKSGVFGTMPETGVYVGFRKRVNP